MSLRVVRALGASLVVLCSVGLGADSARAGAFSNFSECEDPATVWNSALTSIANFSSFEFGNLSAKVCNGIVKKGVANCKVQTNTAAKCNEQTASSNYNIQLKQCAELATKQERSDCKSTAKGLLKSIKTANKTNKKSGIDACNNEFPAALQNDCVNGIP